MMLMSQTDVEQLVLAEKRLPKDFGVPGSNVLLGAAREPHGSTNASFDHGMYTTTWVASILLPLAMVMDTITMATESQIVRSQCSLEGATMRSSRPRGSL